MLSASSKFERFRNLKMKTTCLSRALPFLAPVALSLILLAAGCGRREPIVAKVGGDAITAAEFQDAMVARYRTEEFAAKRNLEERRQILKDLIDRKLKLQDAYRMNLDRDSAVVAGAEESQKQAAIQELYKVEIMDKVIHPDSIKAYYDKMGTEIRARHILFQTRFDLTPNELADVQAKAERAYNLLMDGADFDSLAREVSEDATTAQNGGDLGYFAWGKMVDEFQEAAFALDIGQISGIVKSSYGFHIIKLEDRRPAPARKPFEEEKENILLALRNKFKDELDKAAEGYLDQLKEDHGMKFDYMNIQKILDKVSDPSVPRNQDYFADFGEEELGWIVVTYDDDTIRVKDLQEEVAKTGRPPRWRDQKAIVQLVERMVLPDFLGERAKAKGLFRSESARNAYTTMLENGMIGRIEAIKIDEQIDLSDSTLLAYYKEHPQDFMTDSTVQVQEIYILEDKEKNQDLDFAKKIANRAKRGENFTKLVQKYSGRVSALKRDGMIGPLTSRQYGAMGRTAFDLNIGEVSDPIQMGRRGWSIIKLIDKTPARVKTFEECKSEVERQVRLHQSEGLRTAWVEVLEGRFPVTIYDDRLMATLPPPEVAKEDTVTAKEPPEPKIRTIPIQTKEKGN